MSKRSWRVESRKYSTVKVKSFEDEGAARRYFQKFGNARLTEYEHLDDGRKLIRSQAVAGDFDFC